MKGYGAWDLGRYGLKLGFSVNGAGSALPALISGIGIDLPIVARPRAERVRPLVSETVLTCSEMSSVGQLKN